MTRRLSVFLLAALLSVPAIAMSERGAQLKEPGALSALWGFLESLAPSRTGVHPRPHSTSVPVRAKGTTGTATGCDLGSVMDPNGCPGHNQATGSSPDLGSVMDPNG